MVNHYMHYLRHDVKIRFPKDLNDPFYAEVQDLDDGFERPMYHITRRNKGPASKVRPNDIIWL